MDTLYLRALKNLIKDQLNYLIVDQQYKSESMLHDQELSLEQKTILQGLSDQIVKFEGTSDDVENAKRIKQLITITLDKVQPARSDHKQPNDEGETISCLRSLERHTEALHKKILELKSKNPELYTYELLDKPLQNNPLHYAYLLVILYHGGEIFAPKRNANVDTRTKKENAVGKRVRALSQRIQPTTSLKNQLDAASEELASLERDNLMISSGEKNLLSWAASKVSFYGFELDLSLAGPGRLKKLIGLTKKQISEINANTFEPEMEQQPQPKEQEESVSSSTP